MAFNSEQKMGHSELLSAGCAITRECDSSTVSGEGSRDCEQQFYRVRGCEESAPVMATIEAEPQSTAVKKAA
jgi:hypothetical protein